MYRKTIYRHHASMPDNRAIYYNRFDFLLKPILYKSYVLQYNNNSLKFVV